MCFFALLPSLSFSAEISEKYGNLARSGRVLLVSLEQESLARRKVLHLHQSTALVRIVIATLKSFQVAEKEIAEGNILKALWIADRALKQALAKIIEKHREYEKQSDTSSSNNSDTEKVFDEYDNSQSRQASKRTSNRNRMIRMALNGSRPNGSDYDEKDQADISSERRSVGVDEQMHV